MLSQPIRRDHLPEQQDWVIDWQANPLPEFLDVEHFSILRSMIQAWILFSDLCWTSPNNQSEIRMELRWPIRSQYLPIKQSQRHGRSRGEQQIIQSNSPALVHNLNSEKIFHLKIFDLNWHYLTTPVVVDCKPELYHIECDVLVEAVENNFADPGVVPGTVNKQQSLKISELTNSKVCTVCCL